MKFKLCYKTYDFGISLASCKGFTDSTGLDLHCVLMDYIYAYTDLADAPELNKVSTLGKLYSRDIACNLFSSITDKELNIPDEEFQDATYRTSWVQSSRIDGFSEPWPLVIVGVAMDINKYISENIHVKKKDISEE